MTAESHAESLDQALNAAEVEIKRLRAALVKIQQWDCLNPPQSALCSDFPWLRRLVDDALGGAS